MQVICIWGFCHSYVFVRRSEADPRPQTAVKYVETQHNWTDVYFRIR